MHKQKFIDRVLPIHGEKFDYSNVPDEFLCTDRVNITCKDCGYSFSVVYSNHMHGTGCKKCQYKRLPQNNKLPLSDFIDRHNKIYDKKFEYISGYNGCLSYITLKCLECMTIFSRRVSSHLEGYGCKKCQIKNLPQNKPWTNDKFIENMNKLHSNKYTYLSDYTNSNGELKILCNTCKKEFIQSCESHMKGNGCPSCNFSKGELKISKFLDTNNIKYELQKRFDECRSNDKYMLRFDFYLPDSNICIEYDGIQHFQPVNRFGGIDRFLKTKENDKLKDEYCKLNSIKMIRISYKEFDLIDNILGDLLNDQ